MESLAERIGLPEPLNGLRAVRHEQQRWQRLGRAEGELHIGYDDQGRPVRAEYHWRRFFSRANPAMADVYTAELWVRQTDGGWLYLVQPGEAGFRHVDHAEVRQIFATHLGLEAGA